MTIFLAKHRLNTSLKKRTTYSTQETQREVCCAFFSHYFPQKRQMTNYKKQKISGETTKESQDRKTSDKPKTSTDPANRQDVMHILPC